MTGIIQSHYPETFGTHTVEKFRLLFWTTMYMIKAVTKRKTGWERTLFTASILKTTTSALNAVIWCGLTSGFENTLSGAYVSESININKWED